MKEKLNDISYLDGELNKYILNHQDSHINSILLCWRFLKKKIYEKSTARKKGLIIHKVNCKKSEKNQVEK